MSLNSASVDDLRTAAVAAVAATAALVPVVATVSSTGSDADSEEGNAHNTMGVSFDPNEAYFEEYDLDPDYVAHMRAPDVDYETAAFVMEDLADDTHMREASVQLHHKIKEELRRAKFDPFAERRAAESDPLLSSSKRLAAADEKARKQMSGPTIKREKFTANYWAHWNREKNLLEDISLQEKLKQDALDETAHIRYQRHLATLYGCSEELPLLTGQDTLLLSSSSGQLDFTTSAVGNLPPLAATTSTAAANNRHSNSSKTNNNESSGVKSHNTVGRKTLRVMQQQSSMKGPSFDAPKSRYDANRSRLFDSHLLGDNSVQQLWSKSLKRSVPQHPADRKVLYSKPELSNTLKAAMVSSTMVLATEAVASTAAGTATTATAATTTAVKDTTPLPLRSIQKTVLAADVAAAGEVVTAPAAAGKSSNSDSGALGVYYREGVRVKGGSFAVQSPSRPKLAADRLLTQNIDSLGHSEFGVDATNSMLRKGPVFGTEMRFKFELAAADKKVSTGNSSSNAAVATVVRADITERHPVPAMGFGSADRFQKQAEAGSVMLRIPVKANKIDPAVVEVDIEEQRSDSVGTIAGADASRQHEKQFCQPATSAISTAVVDNNAFDADPLVSSDNSHVSDTDNIKSGSSSSSNQQYVEYEYFPNDDPGPAHYQVKRLFDDVKQPDFAALYQKHKDPPPGLSRLSGFELARVGKFGFGCNRQEHVLYGMCLDGKCCRRGQSEHTVLQRNDLRRLAGYQAVKRFGRMNSSSDNNEDTSSSGNGNSLRSSDALRDEIVYSDAMLPLLQAPKYLVDPLYAAAYAGDINAIKKLGLVKANPNLQHPESGYTPLHAAVFRCQLTAVVAVVNCFRGRVLLYLQDKKGDTALHLAARAGYAEIAGVLCDEPHCDPLAKKNFYGQFPIDIAKNHKTFQMIKICQDRNALREELQALRDTKKRPDVVGASAINAKATMAKTIEQIS